MNALFAALTRNELIAVIAVVAVIVVMTIIIIAVRVSRSKKKNEVSNAPSGSEKEIADKTETETNDNADEIVDDKDEKSDEEQSTDDEVEDEQAEDEAAATDEPAEETAAVEEEAVEERAEETVAEQEPIEEAPEDESVEETAAVEEPVAEEPAESVVEETVAEPAAAVAEQAVEEPKQAPVADEKYPKFIEKYLKTLKGENRDAFENIVLHNSEDLKTRIKLPVSQYADEKEFLADYFRSCSKLAKRMPIAVTEMLYKRNSEFTETDKDRSRAMRKMIAAYYSRRKEEDTLGRCEALCKEDTDYYLQTVGLREKALPPLKKLVVMCVAQNRFDDAVSWCDVAIENAIIDAKGAGYEQRKDKVLQKKEKYLAKQAKLAAKKNK